MRFLILLLCCGLAGLGAQAAQPAATALQRFSVVLLLPDAQLQERVQSIDAMSHYLKAVEATVASTTAAAAWASNAGFVVLAVRPGPEARVWWDLESALSAEQQQALEAALYRIPPFVVRRGPVVVALKLGWGGAPEPQRRAPAPAEWKALSKAAGRALPLDELVLAAWPVAPMTAASAASAP